MKDDKTLSGYPRTAFKLEIPVGGGDHAEPDGDEGEGEDAPGELGRMAMRAMKIGDGEAFEEAVRKICGDSYGGAEEKTPVPMGAKH